MRKLLPTSAESRPRRPRSMIATAVALLLLAMLTPVFYEASRVCAARWRGMVGVVEQPETPVLDAIGDGWVAVRHGLRRQSNSLFNSGSWKPSYVVPFALFWTGVLALALRKC